MSYIDTAGVNGYLKSCNNVVIIPCQYQDLPGFLSIDSSCVALVRSTAGNFSNEAYQQSQI
jgi:hypothetical protein